MVGVDAVPVVGARHSGCSALRPAEASEDTGTGLTEISSLFGCELHLGTTSRLCQVSELVDKEGRKEVRPGLLQQVS